MGSGLRVWSRAHGSVCHVGSGCEECCNRWAFPASPCPLLSGVPAVAHPPPCSMPPLQPTAFGHFLVGGRCAASGFVQGACMWGSPCPESYRLQHVAIGRGTSLMSALHVASCSHTPCPSHVLVLSVQGSMTHGGGGHDA